MTKPKTGTTTTNNTTINNNTSTNQGIPWLDSTPDMLVNRLVTQSPFGMALEQPLQYASGGLSLAGGGSSSSCDSCLASIFSDSKNMPKFVPCSTDLLHTSGGAKKASFVHSPLKQIMSHISPQGNMGGLAGGGLPKKYQEAAPKGHNPEFVTGLTGYYADGEGTGQSDDIPAMLHDGDYVMDAETVSALGDGSSKAGREVLDSFREKVPHSLKSGGKVVPARIADGEYVFPESFVTALGGGDNKRGAEILDGLREKLRAHKRAAPLNKIPPKAKSPLAYIGKSKG